MNKRTANPSFETNDPENQKDFGATHTENRGIYIRHFNTLVNCALCENINPHGKCDNLFVSC